MPLVLTRTPDEGHNTIVIGGGIKVKIIRVRGDDVRIAIDAPSHVTVCREELITKAT